MTSPTSQQDLTALADEIKQYLPDATAQQRMQFAVQVRRLKQVEDYLKDNPDDREFAQEQLDLAKNALDYKQPYRIAVIGKTRSGKSTSINALLGRPLVLARQGKAATGVALEIFLDISESDREFAFVTYRDEANIRGLINQFLKSYKIDPTPLPQTLNADCAGILANLPPGIQLLERSLKEFEELRKNFADMIMQYSHHAIHTLQKQYYLDVEADREELLKLTDEHSLINQTSQRRISLIKSISYHIQPSSANHEIGGLRLPKNVCLVDLPGLDGSPLHNIIIGEGIQTSDAVVVIAHPTKLRETGDEYLLDRVRRYIGQGGNLQSGEKIFLALNARDHIIQDKEQAPEKLYQGMRELIELIIPGYTQHPDLAHRGGEHPFFLTSARAAYLAQKSLKGETLDNPDEYESVKLILGLQGKSDREILEASQIPKLAEALSNFARDNRINGQIRDGQLALDNLTNGLQSKYQAEKDQYFETHGSLSVDREFSKSLQRREEALEQLIISFHRRVENSFEKWREQCHPTLNLLCEETDRYLLDKMPQIWDDARRPSMIRTTRHFIDNTSYMQVMGAAEALLWKQLTVRVPRLSDRFVEFYKQFLQAERLIQQITEQCYGYATANDLHSEFNDWIQHMHRKLTGVAERIALTIMTDPARSFFANPNQNKTVPLLQSLEQIQVQQNPDKQSFTPFIGVVRKHYQSSVEGSMIALLNLFRYEMMVVEDHLLDYVRDTINRIASTKDPAVMQQVLTHETNADLERLKRVEQKLSILSKLRNPADHGFDIAA